MQYARQVGLDMTRFTQALASERGKGAVDADMTEGNSIGSSQGQFQATLVGTTLLGVKRYIQVEGKPTTGSIGGLNNATFAGKCLLDMGDGSQPLSDVPFTVVIVTNADGTGSLALQLGGANLPAATVNDGYMTIK